MPFFAATRAPVSLSQSLAYYKSPSLVSNAFLHCIRGAPVAALSFLTELAGMVEKLKDDEDLLRKFFSFKSILYTTNI